MQYIVEHAEARFAVVEDQEQVDKLLRVREQCPRLEFIVYEDARGLRALLGARPAEPGRAGGARREVRRSDSPTYFEEEVARGRPGRPRGHLLHLRHDRGAQGRDAVAPEPDRDGAHRDRARGPRARRRGARVPADGLGRRPHASPTRRRSSPASRSTARRARDTVLARPQGDRPDLLLRAAPHLGEHPHRRHDPHRGRGVAQAPADPLLPRPGPGGSSDVGSPASPCRC